jgi:hypothetical protein
MAFKKSASRKCPVCVAFSEEKVDEVNKGLEPLLADIKESGEVPKAKDHRFGVLANHLGVSPFALRFHLSKCLIKREIDEQMMVEFTDMLDALHTAKIEYKETPTLPYASALKQIHSAVMDMHDRMMGDADPEQAVQFIAETVISHVMRQSLGVYAKEIRALTQTIKPYLAPQIQIQAVKMGETALMSASTALHEAAQEALENVCTYYKVELDAASKKPLLAGIAVPKKGLDAPVSTKVH